MVKSFIRHQQPADQATDFLYLFFCLLDVFAVPVAFMQIKKTQKYYKKNATFFDLFSFYVDLLFAAVVEVCAFI